MGKMNNPRKLLRRLLKKTLMRRRLTPLMKKNSRKTKSLKKSR